MDYSSSAIQDFINHCEFQIQKGCGYDLQNQLEKINAAKVPANKRLSLANICRRVGLINLAIRILAPRIQRHRLATSLDTTDLELVEYAVLLQRVGAVSESFYHLEKVDVGRTPKALLHQAFGHFKTWDHEKAIPHLLTYIEKDLNPYDLLIGQLNLALSYCITNQLEKSHALTLNCIETAQKLQKVRILGNCYELLTQIHIFKNDFSKARNFLKSAESILQENQTFDAYYVKKWQSFFYALDQKSERPLLEFQEQALKGRFWEDYRDADLLKLILKFEAKGYEKLIFGTPYRGYRERCARALGFPNIENTEYLWGEAEAPRLDIYLCQWNQQEFVAPGKKDHQLIEFLTRDFYRPSRIGDIFSNIYPDEYFDIDSSPNRMHKLISRTNKTIEERQLPLEIHQFDGFYQLRPKNNVALNIPLQRPKVDGPEALLYRIRTQVDSSFPFKASELKQQFGLKTSKVQSLLKYGVDSGRVIKIGNGPGTLYQFAS